MSEILPVTVVAAIILFFVREVLEWNRRRRIDNRKRTAIKTLLLALCERNLWVIKSIDMAARRIHEALEVDRDSSVIVREDSREFLVWKVELLGGHSGGAIPLVQINEIEKFLMDAALLGDELFDAMMKSHDALAELGHIRSGLYEHAQRWNEDDEPYLADYWGYAKNVLEDVKADLKGLYLICGGKEPFEHRVR